MSLFRKPEPAAPPAPDPIPPAPAPIRDAATIRAELQMAADSIAPLAERLRDAQEAVIAEQQAYDVALRENALGRSPAEPERAELETALARLAALKRIGVQHDSTILTLKSELAQAEFREASAQGAERLGPLLAVAEAQAAEFRSAIVAANMAERNLFDTLYNEKTGLKQIVDGAENTERARKTRFRLSNEVQKTAQQNGYNLNPSFETDGLPNWGKQYVEQYYHRGRGGEDFQRAELAQRADAAAKKY